MSVISLSSMQPIRQLAYIPSLTVGHIHPPSKLVGSTRVFYKVQKEKEMARLV